MNKTLEIILGHWLIPIVAVLSLIIALIILYPAPEHPYETFTKALYNGTHLRDYYFECYEDKAIITPTNTSIYVGQGWQDPRPDELKFRECGRKKCLIG